MDIRDLLLDRLEVSIRQFSKETGISRPTINNILDKRGKHKTRLITIKKICKYFNVDFKDYI